MFRNISYFVFFSYAALFINPLVSQSIIVSDNFSSGVRNVQNLPNQAAWFAAGDGNRLFANSANGGTMTLNQVNVGDANTGALVYFTDSGGISLPAGGSLTVSFDFRVSGVFDSNDNRMWIGLFNSHGNRLTADQQVTDAGTSSGNRFMDMPLFEPYTGYEAAFNIDRSEAFGTGKTDSTNSRLYRRGPGTGTRIFTTSNAAGIGSSNPETMRNLALLDDTTYTLVYEVRRFETSDQIRATLTITGGDLPPEGQTMTGTDPQMLETTFDTFGIWQSRFVTSEATFSGEFVFDNFEVSFVPEPATITVLFGALVLVAGILRRRRLK